MNVLESESGESLTGPNFICSNLFAYLAILTPQFLENIHMEKSICCVNRQMQNSQQGNLLRNPSPGSTISVNVCTYCQSQAAHCIHQLFYPYIFISFLSYHPILYPFICDFFPVKILENETNVCMCHDVNLASTREGVGWRD